MKTRRADVLSPTAPRRPLDRKRPLDPRGPMMEWLEQRIAFTINYAVLPGSTLDVFPISSILPAGTDRMAVNLSTVPGVGHGTIYRVSGVDAYPWGSRAPNAFAPGSPQNRIFGGEGFRYVNNGTGNGTTESIPVTFRDSTGFTQVNDTIVITINSNLTPPAIDTQPNPFIQIPPGGKATMSVVAHGTPAPTYQWYKGIAPDSSNPIAGATSATYTTDALGPVAQYMYWVKVSNPSGSVPSQTVTVQVATATSVVTSDVSVPYKTTNQSVTLNATVSPAENVGNVTYTSLAMGGATATSGTVVNGIAPATSFTIPGGTAAGTYPFEAHYAAPAGIAESFNTKTITVTKASTTTSTTSKTAVASGADQSIPLTASVASAAGTVAEGTVTFTLLDASNNPVGSPVTSGTVANGTAAANYSLPANTRANTYTIKTVYNPGPDYNGSQDTLHTLIESPLVTSAVATSIPGSATTLTINGFGFDPVLASHNVAGFSGGASGSVTAATPTQLTVSNVLGLTAGALQSTVTVNGVSSGAGITIGTVVPVITPSSIVIGKTQSTLVINGFGFSVVNSNANVLVFNPLVPYTVTQSSRTQLTVTFNGPLQNGPLNASVTSNGVSSGAAVQVAVVDAIPPTATNGRINLNGSSLGKVSIDLSDNFAPALLLSKFQVVGVGSPAVTINPTGVVQDPVTHTATFSFAAPFANRNYRGTLTAAGLADAVGNPMAANYVFDFYFLMGDADRDRTVGPSDFNLLASHFGQPGQVWAGGDFDGDGSVGPADFNLLASNFSKSVPAPLPLVAGVSAAAPSASGGASATRVLPVRATTFAPAVQAARPKVKPSLAAQLLDGDAAAE